MKLQSGQIFSPLEKPRKSFITFWKHSHIKTNYIEVCLCASQYRKPCRRAMNIKPPKFSNLEFLTLEIKISATSSREKHRSVQACWKEATRTSLLTDHRPRGKLCFTRFGEEDLTPKPGEGFVNFHKRSWGQLVSIKLIGSRYTMQLHSGRRALHMLIWALAHLLVPLYRLWDTNIYVSFHHS